MTDEKKIINDIEITPDLDKELHSQPNLRVVYGMQLAKLQAKVSEAEMNLKMNKGLADREYRLSPPKGIKPTEAALKALIESDSNVIDSFRQLTEAEEKRDVARAIVEALDHKRDSLVQLCKRDAAERADTTNAVPVSR